MSAKVVNHDTVFSVLGRDYNFMTSLAEVFKMGNNNTSNAENHCSVPNVTFHYSLYATTYIVIFIPGLLANSSALWVL